MYKTRFITSISVLSIIGIGVAVIISSLFISSFSDNNSYFNLDVKSEGKFNFLEVNPNISDSDNSTWQYAEWRDFILLEHLNTTYDELDECFKNNATFQHNLNVLTLAYWGFANGSLTEDDLQDVYQELYHDTVILEVKDIPIRTDEKMRINYAVKVNDDAIQHYVVSSVIFKFKSTDPNGNWVTTEGYVEVGAKAGPWIDLCVGLCDPFCQKGTAYQLSSDIETHSVEDDLQVLVSAVGYVNYPYIPFIIDLPLEVDLVDDDTTPPYLNILYKDGINETHGTDANPGYWEIHMSDSQSGLDMSKFHVYIDGQLMEDDLQQPVPNSLGLHNILVDICDGDNDRPADCEFTNEKYTVEIIDDDSTAPTGDIQYNGGKTDGNPGVWSISLNEVESNIMEVKIYIDGVLKYDFFPYENSIMVDIDVPNDLGLHTIEVVAFNDDQDRGSIDIEYNNNLEDSVIIVDDDKTAPSINIDHSGGTTDQDPGKWLIDIYEDESNIGQIKIYIDGELKYNPYINDKFYSFEADVPNSLGVHTIEVEACNDDQDRLNDGECSVFDETITITDDDTTAPNIELIETLMQWRGDEISLTFNLYASDESGISDLRVEINGLTFIGSGPHEIILPPGKYIAHLQATDADSDRLDDESTVTRLITVYFDLTPPETSISYDPYYIDEDIQIFVSSDTLFQLSTVDDISGMAHCYYRINGEAWSEYTNSFSLVGSDGNYLIEYYSIDHNGNEEDIKLLNVMLDTEAPDTEISYSPKFIDDEGVIFVSSISEFTIMCSDALSGVFNQYYSIDGVNFIEYTGPFTLSSDSSTVDIFYYSIDNLGNAETLVKQLTVIIDSSAPTSNYEIDFFYSDSIGTTFITSDAFLSLSCIDDLLDVCEIYYRVNNSGWFLYHGPFHLNDLDAQYIVDFYSVDAVMNQEGINTFTVYLDNNAALTEIIMTPSKVEEDLIYVMEDTYYILEAVDNFSGVSQIFYRINGSEWILYDGPFNITDAFVKVIIDYYSIDYLGNVEEYKTIEVLFTEDYVEGFGILRINGEIYRGDAFLFISSTTITMEVEGATASWDVVKEREFSGLEIYTAEGELGRIKVIIFTIRGQQYILAIGNGVFFTN